MFQVINEDILNHQTEALVIGLFEENKHEQNEYQLLNERMSEQLDELVQAGDLSYTFGSVSKIHTLNQLTAKRIYVIGMGKREELNVDKLRKSFGRLFKQLKKDRINEISISWDSFLSTKSFDYVEAVGEALAMAPYKLETYHTKDKEEVVELEKLTMITGLEEELVLKALDTGFALGNGTNIARHLVNLPSNILTASELASFSINIAEKHGLEIDVFDKKDIEDLGMGALLAVNQGSEEPPRFIVMKYQGKATWEDPIALVGKGITFDTGGYSIKPKDGIVGMKMDMGGAASVLGAMDAIGAVKPEENVIALIPSTDNMISGSAFKPDDVIVSMSGKTIEIRNTDAEGRLALADAITYARQQGASRIIDVATLTGGVVVALGDEMTGAMTNNNDWLEEVTKASEQVGELIWELPYNDVFKKKVRTSHIADLNNSPGRKGHAVLAGAFVGDFAEDTPWVHLDIAGTAMSEGEHDLGPKGPTGSMVRTLAKTIMNR
ncbi:leucyl aminopeptidase [Halalkalibacillus sediminis]|uniref:leucyl aminopeptidase n=1 Tax=Halalkalibacillus sediminis TaxID=2018042 RepID=UPI00117AEC18|nr:leucyl aminopeptidase [Halalkalibacillus sediminis]